MKRFVAPAKCQLTFAVTIVMCIAPTVCQLTTQPVSFSGTTTGTWDIQFQLESNHFTFQSIPLATESKAGKVRSDGRCGQRFVSPLTGVSPSECDPRSERPCCSDFGYCGASASHCKCRGCTDYRQFIFGFFLSFSFSNWIELSGFIHLRSTRVLLTSGRRRGGLGVAGLSLTVCGQSGLQVRHRSYFLIRLWSPIVW